MSRIPADLRQVLLTLADGLVSCQRLLDVALSLHDRYGSSLGEQYAQLARLARRLCQVSHCERDVWRWCLRQDWRKVLPKVVCFPLPTFHLVHGLREQAHGFLLPHLVLATQTSNKTRHVYLQWARTVSAKQELGKCAVRFASLYRHNLPLFHAVFGTKQARQTSVR